MSISSSTGDASSHRPIDLARDAIESSDDVGHRVATALTAIRQWRAPGQPASADRAYPFTPNLAKAVLDREIAADQNSDSRLRAELITLKEKKRLLMAQCAELDRQRDAEQRQHDESDRQERERSAAQCAEAEDALAHAEDMLAIATADMQSADDLMDAADRRSDIGRARRPRVDEKCRRCSTEAKAEALRAKHAADLAMIIRVGDRHIPWMSEPVIAGQRMAPMGCAVTPVQMSAPYSRMVGCLGRIAVMVDWKAPDVMEQVALILDAQRIPCRTRGQPVKQAGHGVLSKPLEGEVVAQRWTPDTAMRAALHFLIGQGVEPARTDAVIFIHSQAPGRNSAATKTEESVHILWSRRRDDGAYHVNPHACVSALISRTRYDNHAGINPGRIGISLSHKGPVRTGMARVREGTLTSWYVDPVTGAKVDEISILGDLIAQRLAATGRPDYGDIAGVWVMKPSYRTPEEIRLILKHLSQGD